MNNVSDFNAIKIWNTVPEEIRKQIVQNVFCGNCTVTSLAPGYSITYKKNVGILLKGKCIKCGKEVCRVVEE